MKQLYQVEMNEFKYWWVKAEDPIAGPSVVFCGLFGRAVWTVGGMFLMHINLFPRLVKIQTRCSKTRPPVSLRIIGPGAKTFTAQLRYHLHPW